MIYPDELREEILEKAISSKKTPMVQLAKEFGISRGTLLSWRKEVGLLETYVPGLYNDERRLKQRYINDFGYF